MSPTDQITAFVQKIYLVIKNRRYDDLAGVDGQDYISQVFDWTNMYVDELENTVNPVDNTPVDWWFARENGATLGSVTVGASSVTLPTTVDHLVVEENRYVQVVVNGVVVSNFAVVSPGDINNRSNTFSEDKCAVVGLSVVFSRKFTDKEANGSVIGDVINKLPRLSATNVKLLSIVRPQTLLMLGVAKNATLPDIVQGKLSPSYATKYDGLLNGAIARSVATSQSATAARDDYSHIRGV